MISVGGIDVKIIATPGHTKSGVCYLIGGNLFSGDTLFIEGCGLCYGRGADPRELYISLTKLKNILPNDTLVFPVDIVTGKKLDRVCLK